MNDPEPADNKSGAPPSPLRRRRRYINRRNAIIAGILIGVGAAALILIALLSYRLGYVDAYIAGQVKDTLSKYGVRAEIREFHTAFSPQTVEMLGVELYDAQTGAKLGKIDRILATVRIEDLYALNLQRNINLQDLQLEGLELWVNFDEQGRSNFRNVHIPPPEPNQRILFAYSTAHVEIKNALIHYGDALHRLSGEARNLRATIQPDDPNAPSSSWMNTVTLSATNSTFAYDNRPINNIDIEARGRVNQIRAEIQELKLRSPVAEATLSGVMGDWRALQYTFNVTSTVDLTQLSDVLATGTTLRGVGNFSGTITGEGDKYQLDANVKSDALAADGVRLQGLNVNAKGTGQGKSYDFNGRAVAQLLNAGDFQLNAVQLAGRVMGTGSDFRWVGDLRAAAEKSYGTTITGLILRDAVAEYRDGVLTASAPQLTGSSVTTATARVAGGVQANDIRVRSENGVTTATIASAKAGKIQAANASVDGLTAKGIDANSRDGVTNVTIKEVQVGAINASGAQTGSINIAGVRLGIRDGRVQGTTSDINAGTVKLENGQVENVKLAKPSFTLEPSGRYRASADLSLGGGVLGEMRLGPARASVTATSDQIQLTSFVAEALNGRATGNATIALTKRGTSRVATDFNNFDLAAIIAVVSGRAVPVASRATGRADLTFTDTDLATATGTVNAQLQSAPATSDFTPLSGDVALTANHGLFQIQRANLQTAATRLTAGGQFAVDQPVSNLRVDVASTDASEIQRLLISSGALPEVYEQFRTYGIELGGKLNFNGTLAGALKDPLVSGHAELGSLSMNGRELGSLAANITSTATETRVDNGRLVQANGGGAQFSLKIPRTGESNTEIAATLDRMNAGSLIATFPTRQTREQFADTDAEVSGSIHVTGIPKNMSGVADLQFGKGKLAGEPLQNLTAHATFVGPNVNLERVDANFDAGHIVGNGKYNLDTKAFDVKFTGDRVQLERLGALANRPNLPKFGGIANVNITASGVGDDISSYQINFNAESNNVTIDGRAAGALKLVGVTENKQLNVTFSTTGLLGEQPQVITARVDLSKDKLPAVVESNITGADLTQVLKLLLPQTDVAVTGRATGTLKLSGNLLDEDDNFDWRALTGQATFTELTISVADVQLMPNGPLVVDFAPNEMNFHETRFTGPGTNVTIAGTVATGPGGRQNLDVNGDVNLRIFSGISPDVFSSGVARLFLRVAGTYDDPRMLGTAEVTGASVSVFSGDQTITVQNLTGLIRFNSNQAQIERLTGTLGGGKVTASGGALLTGSSRGRFVINVRGDNVTLRYPKDFLSTVTADLSLSGDMQNQFITGYVDVKRTEYTKDIELADLINQRPETTIEEGGRFSFAETAVLDKLRVEGRNALVMRNNLGDVVASVNLRLDGPIGDPIIQGRVTATRGTLNFRNSPYEVTRGLVDFPGRLSADPILNIEGESVIRGYRVRAAISGPLSHPQTTVSSEPALPQADVVSLILTGSLSTSDQSTSVLAQSGLGTAASLLTDALINAPVSRASNKLFGLSRLEISPVMAGTGSTPTARLTVARRISKDVTAIYSTNLASDPNMILAVEYRVSNRLSFIALYEQGSQRNLSNRNNNFSFELRFRKRF